MTKQYFLGLLLLSAISVGFAACTKTDTTATNSTGTTQTAPLEPSQQKLLDLVNKTRTSGCNCGGKFFPAVNSVSWNDALTAAAKKHSEYMNSSGNFSHTGEGGSNAGDRITAEGYNWTAYGENIAEGYPTEEEVVQAWLASPGHCENIMNKDFTEMGVATSGIYWTQDFATKD